MPTVGLKTLTLSGRAPGVGGVQEQEPVTLSGDQSTRARIAIGLALINLLEKDNDPRAPEVAAKLGEQVAELRARLDAG